MTELPTYLVAQGFLQGKLLPHISEISRTLRRFQGEAAAIPASALFARVEKGLLDILTQGLKSGEKGEEAKKKEEKIGR